MTGVDISEPETAQCWFHNVPETFTPGESYKCCGECWHVWQTEAEFWADIDRVNEGWPKIPHSAHIYSCPLCTHDF